MSPRLISISSFSVIVTAIGGYASETGPSAVSIDAISVSRPAGKARIRSPGFRTPEATVPAYPRKSRFSCDCGRTTYCTGKRTSTRLRSLATCSRSRWLSSGAPSNQGMLVERVTTLSPLSAESGMKVRSRRRSREANSVNSRRIPSKTSSDQSTRSILLTQTTMCGTPSSVAMKA